MPRRRVRADAARCRVYRKRLLRGGNGGCGASSLMLVLGRILRRGGRMAAGNPQHEQHPLPRGGLGGLLRLRLSFLSDPPPRSAGGLRLASLHRSPVGAGRPACVPAGGGRTGPAHGRRSGRGRWGRGAGGTCSAFLPSVAAVWTRRALPAAGASSGGRWPRLLSLPWNPCRRRGRT